MAESGRLVILSGPSGAGKSTVVRELLAACSLPLVLFVSATTRAPRPGEVNGKDYHFITKQEFEQRREADEFLECKEVFGRGDWYGTLRETVDSGLSSGKWVILEIDVQGALTVIDRRPDTISLFVHPGSEEELERRLRRRGTDSEEAIRRRLEVAADELTYKHHYDYEVINRDVAETVREICQLLKQSINQESKHNA
ncbi:MAG: guanylate kinase [Pirellulales bacterium]